MPRRAPRIPKAVERALDRRVNKAIAQILAATEDVGLSDDDLADIVRDELRDVEDVFMQALDTAWDTPGPDVNTLWIMRLSDASRRPAHRRGGHRAAG